MSGGARSSSMCFFTSTETVGTIRDGEPRTATSIFTELLSSECLSSSSMLLYVPGDRRDYYSIRDGVPRTATSTFTQTLCSEWGIAFQLVLLWWLCLLHLSREGRQSSLATVTAVLTLAACVTVIMTTTILNKTGDFQCFTDLPLDFSLVGTLSLSLLV